MLQAPHTRLVANYVPNAIEHINAFTSRLHKPIVKMSSSNRESGQNENLTNIYNRIHMLDFTAPELFLLVLLVVMSLVGLLLCLESNDCVKKLLEERKRMRKALQYKPSEELSRVSRHQEEVVLKPVKDVGKENDDDNTDDVMEIQVKDQNRSSVATDLEIESL